MLTLIACLIIAAFVGSVVLVHVLALQAVFASANHADSRCEVRRPRSFLPDVPV
jgi:hypothetical protein